MQCQQFQRTHTSADHSIIIQCRLRQWDVRHKSTRRPTNKEHGHIIQLRAVSLYLPRTLPHSHVLCQGNKSKRHSDTIHFKHKNITNPTITHADKVMQALAECIKTITGATGETTAQEVKALQHIVKATQAILHKSEAPSNNSNAEQRAPRVPNIPRVNALPRVPPATADNQRITGEISKVINKAISALTTMPTSALTPDTTSKPASAPTTSAKQDCLQKRCIAGLHNDTNTTGNSPQIRTRVQLAMAAARVAPPAMSTRARARSSIQPPTWQPGTTPGFAAAVMRQKRHQ